MKTRTANQAYTEATNDITNLIRELKNKLDTHKTRQAKRPKDWGYVGDLNYIKENLEDMLRGFCD